MSFDPTDEEEELFPGVESDASGDADGSASRAEEEAVEKASKAARKLEPIVLAHVLGPKYQPVKPRVIAKQLKLPSEQHKALKLAIRRLAKAGKLSYGAGHLVKPPQRKNADNRRAKIADAEPQVRSRKAEVGGRDKNVIVG